MIGKFQFFGGGQGFHRSICLGMPHIFDSFNSLQYRRKILVLDCFEFLSEEYNVTKY